MKQTLTPDSGEVHIVELTLTEDITEAGRTEQTRTTLREWSSTDAGQPQGAYNGEVPDAGHHRSTKNGADGATGRGPV
jgi:hypothetical protein